MKKLLFLMAGAAMLLASCNNDVLVDDPSSDPTKMKTIEFASSTNMAQRSAAKEAGYTFLSGEKIGVYGIEETDTSSNWIFLKQMVTNTSSEQTKHLWSYSPKKYWTAGARYEFYGFYPYEQGFAFDQTTKMFSLADYTVSNDTTKMVDLMIAERNLATPNNTVEMLFHHILSNVNFMAKVANDVDTSEVTSVDVISFNITGLLSTGSYQQTGWTANHEAEGKWTNNMAKKYDFPSMAGGKALALPVANHPEKGLRTNLLLMPQTLFYKGNDAKTDATNDPTIDVTFKVSYVDNTTQTFTKSLRLSSILSYKKEVLQDDGSYKVEEVSEPIYEWKPNYKYIYTLAFNPAKTTRVWDADANGSLPGDPTKPDYGGPEKSDDSKYNIDNPNVIQFGEDTDGDGISDKWTEYPVVWEDIDGDGKLEAGVDKDGDGHIDNIDGDNDTDFDNDQQFDPTDGDSVNNPDGKDVILVYYDKDGDGEPDTWRQLEKDPETGEIFPGKETVENYIEFTAKVVDWAVKYGVNYDITK